MRDDTADYRQLFLQDIPLLDVRAPVEFARGAFPNATNMPLLDDRQREQIGIRYKNAGQEEAIRLGLELATPEIRAQRLRDWRGFSNAHPDGFIYCFRGGLRSRTTQQWLQQQGVEYPLVRGGYKAMRRFLLDELEAAAAESPLICLGGLTGVGKTRVLRRIRRHVDLEGIANHRGSAFGRDPLDSQPSSIDWENRVAVEFLKLRQQNRDLPVFVEDEGRRIGRITIPDVLYDAMLRAPRAILQLDTERRIELIADDYVKRAWPGYRATYGDAAEQEFSRFVLENLARIQKRLGGERYRRVRGCFEQALGIFFRDGEASPFYDGIRILLEQYYDPMYRYQIESKGIEIIFEGPEAELLEWAENRGTG